MRDPIDELYEQGDPLDQTAAMQVMRAVTKALLVRLGGNVELSQEELDEALGLNVFFDGTSEPMIVRVVEGDPPETPVLAVPISDRDPGDETPE